MKVSYPNAMLCGIRAKREFNFLGKGKFHPETDH
jgi:hypothetical protein